jgi:hypothetical protein
MKLLASNVLLVSSGQAIEQLLEGTGLVASTEATSHNFPPLPESSACFAHVIGGFRDRVGAAEVTEYFACLGISEADIFSTVKFATQTADWGRYPIVGLGSTANLKRSGGQVYPYCPMLKVWAGGRIHCLDLVWRGHGFAKEFGFLGVSAVPITTWPLASFSP